ncbi:hypothetical protein Tco_0471877 [Tanacetum coccineum]
MAATIAITTIPLPSSSSGLASNKGFVVSYGSELRGDSFGFCYHESRCAFLVIVTAAGALVFATTGVAVGLVLVRRKGAFLSTGHAARRAFGVTQPATERGENITKDVFDSADQPTNPQWCVGVGQTPAKGAIGFVYRTRV